MDCKFISTYSSAFDINCLSHLRNRACCMLPLTYLHLQSSNFRPQVGRGRCRPHMSSCQYEPKCLISMDCLTLTSLLRARLIFLPSAHRKVFNQLVRWETMHRCALKRTNRTCHPWTNPETSAIAFSIKIASETNHGFTATAKRSSHYKR